MNIEKFYQYKHLNKEMPDYLAKFVKKSHYKKNNFQKPNWVMNQKNNQNDYDKLSSQFRGILNKISDSNLQELSAEIIGLNIAKKEHLVNLVEIIFSKAITEHKFCTVYAKLSKHLSSYYIEDDGKVHFRKILINKCQAVFDEAISLDKELGMGYTNAYFKTKDQVIGCITYIAELYNQDLLTHKIISSCFDLITVKVNLKKAYIIEILCTFTSVVATKFAVECPEQFSNKVAILQSIKDGPNMDIKQKFALMDVLDQFKN